MKVVAAFAAAVAALLGAAQAVDIDNGFTQDGSTTYCMGVSSGGSVGTLSFDSLEASNVGRCPVGLTLTLTASEYHVSDVITVKWTAKKNSGVTSSIFPNAIDSTTGLPGAVTTSTLSACTYGTNCATNVVGTPTGADGTNSGAFATDGTKALETNTFTLPTAGDYIIVGLVALPGDSSLNLSAEEYVVFKKISVVSTDTVISSSSSSTTGSVGSVGSSGSSSTEWSTTAPPVTTAPPLTSAPSSSTGSSHADSSASNWNSTTSAPVSTSHSGSTAEQVETSGTDEDNVTSAKSSKTTTTTSTTTTAPTTSDDQTTQTDTGSSGATKSASTSTGSDSFLGTNGVIIIAALVGCCIVGVVGFAFVLRRRKEQRMNANKAFDLHSPSLASDMDDSALNGHGGNGKIDLTYVANISARNNDKSAENMMSEESSVAIMASAERGSELNSSNGSSMHSLPKSSLDTDEYSEKVSYGASGAAGHQNEAEIDAYRISNMSELSSLASGSQSEASMSNFGDSVVSARQNKYLTSNDWNDSESSRMDSRLDSMEQAELKARGFGSIGGFSTVSGFSEDNTSRITGMSDHDSNRDIGFSMPSRPTVESRFTEDYRVTEDSRPTVDSRFTEDYRATEDSHVTEDSRATGFSEAMDASRLQSEVSVDSYGFRASRESADSYSSGMSPYSREGSRISGFSVDSNLDSSSGSSKY
ncbi:unnamed protein product [Phytophthora lilii]|uniref:Unnamed protein product n=1 Tax=Phytophthora lilii TaxID=2077276 RepID=A0A9W6WH22_9STRA|nr:unnamed protein product [Phytophthora lilii]